METRSLEEARAIHSAINSPIEVELTDRRRPFAWQANHAPLISLVGDYSASRTITGVPEWSYRCRLPGCATALGGYCFEQ